MQCVKREEKTYKLVQFSVQIDGLYGLLGPLNVSPHLIPLQALIYNFQSLIHLNENFSQVSGCRKERRVEETHQRVWGIILLAHNPRDTSLKFRRHLCQPLNIWWSSLVESSFNILVFIFNLLVNLISVLLAI